MINSSTELENLHVSPPDAKPVLYVCYYFIFCALAELKH